MWKNHYDCSIAESLEFNEIAIGSRKCGKVITIEVLKSIGNQWSFSSEEANVDKTVTIVLLQ